MTNRFDSMILNLYKQRAWLIFEPDIIRANAVANLVRQATLKEVGEWLDTKLWHTHLGKQDYTQITRSETEALKLGKISNA